MTSLPSSTPRGVRDLFSAEMSATEAEVRALISPCNPLNGQRYTETAINSCHHLAQQTTCSTVTSSADKAPGRPPLPGSGRAVENPFAHKILQLAWSLPIARNGLIRVEAKTQKRKKKYVKLCICNGLKCSDLGEERESP